MANFTSMVSIGFSLVFFGGFLFFNSCVAEEPLPVSDEKMIEVLADVHIAEAVLASLTPQQRDTMAAVYYGQVMEIHGLDREVFDTCLAVLRRNPDKMQEIYSQVFEKLEKEKLEKGQDAETPLEPR